VTAPKIDAKTRFCITIETVSNVDSVCFALIIVFIVFIVYRSSLTP
jgi:hypothetical protein